MKLSTKIFSVIFGLTLVPALWLGMYTMQGIIPTPNGFTFNFSTLGIIGIGFIVVNTIFGSILFTRFLKNLSLSKALFFSILPLTLVYGALVFIITDVPRYNSGTAVAVKAVLNLETTNPYNTVLWVALLSVVYIAALFLIFAIFCKPVSRLEKIVDRLSDGMVKEEHFKLGGVKQFKKLEHSLNKINYNYHEKDNKIKETNLEAQKFIPKQFFKFLGKSSIYELELGNQVKKEATTLFCDLVSATKTSQTLSLEENFNFINSYLNVVSPIVRRNDGFIDKYLGDGILAVFPRSENALDCAHAISKAIEVKNKNSKHLPEVEFRMSIHTGEVIFGVVGDEERKSPTIISDAVNLASKMEEINKFLGSKLIFSKNTLNELPTKYKLYYRYLGSLSLEGSVELPLFESLEVYHKDKREKLVHLKSRFENAVREYNDGDYEKTKQNLHEVLRFVPDDKPAFIYYNKASEKLKNNQ